MTLYYDSEKATRSGVTDDWSPETGTENMGFETYYITKVVLDKSMKSAKPTSTTRWFSELYSTEAIDNLGYLNTENVTDMSDMFYHCESLTSLDLSGFNTEKVTNMSSMFDYCRVLTSLELNSFNTEKVTNMNYMFDYCEKLKSLDLSSFDTRNVTDMTSMFGDCYSLASIDLSSFNTEKVTDMSKMFINCSNLVSLDLNSFSINPLVTDRMFWGCEKLTTIYCNNAWKSNSNSKDMFYNCKALKGGKGTVYDYKNANDITYAHPDGGTSNPGYFTDNTLASYTVTFKDDISGWSEKQEVEEGSDAIAPTAPKNECYNFVKWDKDFTNIHSNLVVTAVYETQTYNVTFYDANGIAISMKKVECGTAAVAPADPTKTGYTFLKWNKDFSVVKSALDIYSVFSINTYTVTFVDRNGATIKTETVEYGKPATAPAEPVWEGHTFKGWEGGNINSITQNTTFKPLYDISTYTVTFVDWDGRQISKQEIEHGKPAFEPIHPTRPGYTFTGWDPADFSRITSNMTITAQYADALYVVSVFVEGEGEVVTTNSKGEQIDPRVGVPYQTRLTFKAVPAEGWSFKEWNILGANYTEITLVVSMHMPLLATFVKNPTTGIEKLEINAQDKEQKLSPCKVLDPQSHRVYILMPDGTKYDTMGRKVK
ncbi:MAG: BspA family leucine-rich repeat surface protein [Paludibacteraceae bacterium]|nr:BspA family leucine-rich repeat surface protein [Paludibacteraceae bacterium]MBR1808069.1 BspA family leucine-rich repeat surface protein [Paludibacteraceae bacterium]